jgi:hypothetical protein
VAAEVGRTAPRGGPAATIIADLYVQERYGRQPLTPPQEARARRAWRQVRNALLRRRLGGDG